jgi:hypothetical protein
VGVEKAEARKYIDSVGWFGTGVFMTDIFGLGRPSYAMLT